MRASVRTIATLSVLTLVSAFGTAVVAPSAGATSSSGTHVYVSKRGSDSTSCGRASSPCLTIGQAVTNAHDGDTVFVFPGTYAEMVTLSKRLWLFSAHATIDATGKNNGILLQGPGASGSKVSFFSIQNAIGEGLLASGVDNVRLEFNEVSHNDQGTTVANTYPECQPQGEIPGDCGEGLHLQATTNSTVKFNDVSNNAGGILVSDDFAPTHGNLIEFNRVNDNKPDCGITVVGHSPAAGVFDNTISFNDVERNGEGGVLFGAAMAGAGSHDNRITHNYLSENGFAGVTIHSHFPNQNLNNNVIEHNIIKTNNVTGDDDAGVTDTTGILILSQDPSVTITGTQIHHNIIANNHFGVWLTPGHVDSGGISNNLFANVDIDVQQ